MRQADFTARIKKIEITNRALTTGWQQAIRVVLDDIELTNENLLELKQFRPNEPVMVQIHPAQVSLLDKPPAVGQEDSLDQPDEDAFQFIEGEPEDLPPEAVAKEWKFG